MFSYHIARAMARERQRDLVPELRGLKRQPSAFGIENGEGARAVSSGSKLGSRARSRFRRSRADGATGRGHTGKPAKQPLGNSGQADLLDGIIDAYS
jgi:hypothetical protein